MDVPVEVVDKARRIFERAEDHNSMTWSGPYVDSVLAVIQAVWDEAFSSGEYFGYSRAVDGFSLQDREDGEPIAR